MKRTVYVTNSGKTETTYLVKVVDQHGDWEFVRIKSRARAAWYYSNCSMATRLIRETKEVDTGRIVKFVTLGSVNEPTLFEEAEDVKGYQNRPHSINPWVVPVGEAETKGERKRGGKTR